MTPTSRLSALSAAALAIALGFAPSFAAPNKEDRKLCAEAKADDPASLLKCIASLNKRLSEIEDEPEEIEAPDDTDAKIAALENEMRVAKREAAAATEAAKMATEQAAAANVKIDALAESANKVAALETEVASAKNEAAAAKAAAAAADAKADRAGDAADIAIARADAAAAKADTVAGLIPDEDGPPSSQMMAPFTVVDAGGVTILRVEMDGGDAVMTLGGGDARVKMSASGGHSYVSAVSGERMTIMEAGSTIGVTATDPSKGTVGMGHISTGLSGVISLGEGGTVFSIGAEKDKGPALRVFKAGKPVAAIGSNSGADGAGAVFIGNGTSNGVMMTSDGSSNGMLSVFGGGDSPTVELRGGEKQVVVFNDGGTPLAALMESTNSKGGNITLSSPAGSGVFSAGAATDGGGEACVNRQDGKTHCLGVGLPLR